MNSGGGIDEKAYIGARHNSFQNLSEFKRGVEITGGTLGSVDNGIITNGYDDRLFVYTGGEQVAQFASKSTTYCS